MTSGFTSKRTEWTWKLSPNTEPTVRSRVTSRETGFAANQGQLLWYNLIPTSPNQRAQEVFPHTFYSAKPPPAVNAVCLGFSRVRFDLSSVRNDFH